MIVVTYVIDAHGLVAPKVGRLFDNNLRNNITGRTKAPLEGIGKLEIKIEYDGKSETIKVDAERFKKARKRVEDEYTFPIRREVVGDGELVRLGAHYRG